MELFDKKKAEPEAHAGELTPAEKGTPAETFPQRLRQLLTPAITPRVSTEHTPAVVAEEALKSQPPTVLACTLGAIASIGGFMFGYESGQISGMGSQALPLM